MSALVNLFYLYDPWFFHVVRMSVAVGIVVCLFLIYKLYKKNLTDGIWLPLDSIAAIGALIIVSVIPLIVNDTRDYSVPFMYGKALIIFLFGVAVYNSFYRTGNGKTTLIRDLEIGMVIQTVFGLLALCGVPFIVDLVLSTNVVLPRFYGSEQEYRLYNITSSAFFQLSAFYLMLLHFLLAYNEKRNDMNGAYVLLILFIGVISGRTFFMFSIISILLYFKWRYIPSLIAFAAIVLYLAKFHQENIYVQHALEPVINLLNGGGTLSSSTDTLMEKHLFMPTLRQFIGGDGYYFTPDHHYYGGTDSGFLRQILYGGALYCLACLAFTAYFVRKIALNWFDGSRKFSLSVLAILTVLNIKADTYAFPGIMMLMLMFLSLFGPHGKNIVLFKQGKTENV